MTNFYSLEVVGSLAARHNLKGKGIYITLIDDMTCIFRYDSPKKCPTMSICG